MEDRDSIFRNLNRFNILTNKILYNNDNYDFFLDYINKNYKEYFEIIFSFEGYILNELIKNKEITICLYEKLIQTLIDYLKGRRNKAYVDMKEAFSCISNILKRKSANKYPLPMQHGFKAREINDGSVPTKEEMFHIPFQMRHEVQDHRYSVHGIPSIYLGESIYDCYIELNKPSLDNFWVSLFVFSDINFIDLTLSPGGYNLSVSLDLAKEDEESYMANIESLINDILLWPLIMICSIPCKYHTANFKQEYIIPQILYEFCSEEYENYVGVKYYSTKIKYVDQKIFNRAMVNYALPSHNITKSGYCAELVSQLSFTEPIKSCSCEDIEINIENSDTLTGLPILSNMHESLKKDETILLLDKMTIYFDRLIQSFMDEKKIDLLAPLYGWDENKT